MENYQGVAPRYNKMTVAQVKNEINGIMQQIKNKVDSAKSRTDKKVDISKEISQIENLQKERQSGERFRLALINRKNKQTLTVTGPDKFRETVIFDSINNVKTK